MAHTIRNPGIIVFLVIILFATTGCMNTRIVATYDSDNPVPQQVTKWNYFWGLVQPSDVETGSLCENICQVTVKNNLGYIILSSATLGIVVPTTVEYECCAHEPDPGNL
jgi:hypothetical protein